MLEEKIRPGFAFLLLFLLLLTLYANTRNAEWLFDDRSNIVENPNVHLTEWSWEGIIKSFHGRTRDVIDRPVAFLSFALNHYWGRLDVRGYRLVNWGIHGLSALFLYLVFFHTLNSPFLRERYGSKASSLALTASLLWMSHPIHVTAVSLVVQRMASMAGLFYAMSLYFYIRTKQVQEKRRLIGNWILCLTSAFLAFGSKENSWTLPLTCLLWDLAFHQGVRKETVKIFFKKIGMGALLLSLPLAYVLWNHQYSILGAYQERPFTLAERLLTEPRVLFHYASLLIWPWPSRFTLVHEFDLSQSLIQPATTGLSLFFVFALLLWSVTQLSKHPLAAFSVLFYFMNHAMEGSFISLEILYEYRNYLPSMFVFLAVMASIARFSENLPWPVLSTAWKWLAGMALLLQSVATFQYNETLQNPIRAWENNVRKSPGMHLPIQNLALAYYQNGEIAKALEFSQKALKAKNTFKKQAKATSWFTMGLCHQSLGKMEEALHSFNQALVISPFYPDALHEKARALASSGNLDEALKVIERALQTDPYSSSFHFTHAAILMAGGKLEQAIREAEKGLNWNPEDLNLLFFLGEGHRIREDLQRSEAYFLRAVRADPSQCASHLALMEIYQSTQKKELLSREQSALQDLLTSQHKSPEEALLEFDRQWNRSGPERMRNLRQALKAGNPDSPSG